MASRLVSNVPGWGTGALVSTGTLPLGVFHHSFLILWVDVGHAAIWFGSRREHPVNRVDYLDPGVEPKSTTHDLLGFNPN